MKSVKLIATDLDGTLFYPKKRSHMVTKENRAFINRFCGDGGRILLVTGRNSYFGEKVGTKIGMNFDYIACNGALVVSGGKTIFEKHVNNEEARKIVEDLQNIHEAKLIFLFTKDHNMVCQRKEIAKWVKMGYSIYRIFEGTYREPYFKDDALFQEELDNGKIYKILMFPGFGKKSIPFSFELAKKLTGLYPDLNIVASEQAIEITAKGATKREGLSFYLDYNQINVDNVLVVGDSGNDISMFQAFPGRSFCMDHSLEDVKQHASFVIKRFSDIENYVYPSAETTAETTIKKEGN